MQLMINSLEIIGNFMHPADAYRSVLAMMFSLERNPPISIFNSFRCLGISCYKK
jgi:hypothetical protein